MNNTAVNYETLFDASPTVTMVFNVSGKVMASNIAAQELLGYTADEFLKISVEDLVPTHLIQPTQLAWRELIEEKNQESFYVLRNKYDQIFYIHYSIVKIEQTDNYICTLNEVLKYESSTQVDNETIREGRKLLYRELIDRLVEQDSKLSKSLEKEKHFYHLFEHAPIPIIEMNYTAVKEALEQDKDIIGNDPRNYFLNNPKKILHYFQYRRISEINQRATAIVKIDAEGRPNHDNYQLYLPELHEQMAEALSCLIENHHYLRIEMAFREPSGRRRHMIVNFSITSDDFSRTFITFEDVSENVRLLESLEARVQDRTFKLEQINQQLRQEISSREQISRDLRQSEERYRQLNAIYPVGIFHTDAKGKNIYVNAKACEIQGVCVPDAIGYGWLLNVHPEDREKVLNTWEVAVQEGRSVDIEYRFAREDKTIWVNGQTVPEYDEFGEISGFVGILVDITKQREAEEQINQNQIEIAHFSRLNSMGEVASGIAHELNQPLTAINNYASGVKRRLTDLAEQNISKEIFKAIDQTIAQAQRAGDIIHHLKDFLRKGELSKQYFDLNQAIEDVLTFISRPITQNSIHMKLKFDKSLAEISADKIHIEQVILNIINNAIDALLEADSDKKIITIRTERYLNEQIRISISDTGPGIAKDLLDNVFNPFVTTKEQGMGIGLSLCYNIIDKHGGRILVNSEENKGCVFHIILPIS